MIVIPMAGGSTRFYKEGYTLPKYMLKGFGKTLFEHSVESFRQYFECEKFLFIALSIEGFDVYDFIDKKSQMLGISSYKIVLLKELTKGQAETVYLGLKESSASEDEHLTIFNIDTFRPGFEYPTEFNIKEVDGYLETFVGEGENWSNVVPDGNDSNTVLFTAEKMQLSNYCCTGLYYFKYVKDYNIAFEYYNSFDIDDLQGKELYIAPMYNFLIKRNKDIRFSVINSDDVIFCGNPAEYKLFLENK